MGDPEVAPDADPVLEPAIPGAPIGERRPEATPAPITDPDFPELQDRRRPLP